MYAFHGAVKNKSVTPILIVADSGKEEETITRLSRVGFDNILGYLKDGFISWLDSGKKVDVVDRISSDEFANNFEVEDDQVIDVRKESEFDAEHIQHAINKPLANINDWIKEINSQEHFYLHCAGGYRSMIAASILQARGYRNFTEIAGGFNAISKTNVPKTAFMCQSKIANS